MSIKSFAAKVFAYIIRQKTLQWSSRPYRTQDKVFEELIKQGNATVFGQDHDFKSIKNHTDFVDRVPVRDYEELRPYVERVVLGEENVLWKENLYILPKHLELLVVQSIFLLQKNRCQII